LGAHIFFVNTTHTPHHHHTHKKTQSSLTFTVADVATNKKVTAVCPGAAYKVTIAYAGSRHAYLTASAGTFAAAAGTRCLNAVAFPSAATSQVATMTAPCTGEFEGVVNFKARSFGAMSCAASTMMRAHAKRGLCSSYVSAPARLPRPRPQPPPLTR
jgi:hypothetical protein